MGDIYFVQKTGLPCRDSPIPDDGKPVFCCLHGGVIVPRNKKDRKEKALWTKAKWKAFVTVRLNSQEKAAIKDMSLESGEFLQFFMDAATAGYKVSLSYSIPEDVYTVSLTGSYQEKPNAGLTASIRHRDFETALAAMIFATSEDGYGIDWEERFGEVDLDDW